MALNLVFADGFDHYDTLAQRWNGSVPASSGIVSTGHERTGLSACEINTGAFGPQIQYTALTRVIVAGAVNPGNGVPNVGQPGAFWRFGKTPGDPNLFFIHYNNDLSIMATFDNSSTPVGGVTSRARVIQPNAYNFIAARILFSAGAGQVDVWVNGQLELSVAGQTTDTTPPNLMQLTIVGGATTGWWDDFSMWTWDDNNDVFPYVISIYPAMPVSDASPLVWTPSAGVTHFDLVDEIPPNTADFVSAASAGLVDQYVHEIPVNQQVPPIPAATTVRAVLHSNFARVDSGARELASNLDGSTGAGIALSTSYLMRDTGFTPGLASLSALPTTTAGPETTA